MAAIGGLVIFDQVSVSPTVAQVEAVDTVLATITIPADAIVLDVILNASDMDTNGTPTLALDVGDAAGPATPDDNRLVAASVVGQAGTAFRASEDGGLLEGAGINYADLTVTGATVDIEVTVETVAATGAAGTLDFGIMYARR